MPRSEPLWVKIIRWVGRGIALVLAGFILMFIVGEGPPPLYVLAPFLVVLAGLVLGCWYELVGAMLILVAFTYFNIGEWRANGRLLRFGAFHLLLVPSALFLISGIAGRVCRRANAPKQGFDVSTF